MKKFREILVTDHFAEFVSFESVIRTSEWVEEIVEVSQIEELREIDRISSLFVEEVIDSIVVEVGRGGL